MWEGPLEPVLVLLLAHAMDLAYPRHSGLLLRIHPVHTSYVMAVRMGRPFSTRARGGAVWLAVVSSHLAAYALAMYASLTAHRALFIAASAYVLKTSFSLRLLFDTVRRAADCLRAGRLDCARSWVQQIVRRDVRGLREPHLASAAIESLAESLVDGYVSPLFYFILLGPLGALLQRVVNTLDSALGYKDPAYREVGWLSAKADTVINYVPARLTALLIALASPLAGGSARAAIRAVAREHGRTESVNAGYPMSAMAGALGVKLEKVGCYTINEGAGEARWEDVLRALSVAKAAAAAWASLAAVAALVSA